MGSKIGAGIFAFNIAWRAIFIGGLAFLTVYLVATTHLYATALVVTGIAILIAADLARLVTRADRTLERFLEGLAAGSSDTPARRPPGFGGLSAAIDKTAHALRAVRDKRQQDVEYLQSLLDTVSAALLVVGPDGRVTLANRAARNLVHSPVDRLDEIVALGAPAVAALSTLAPGARQIVRLADGRQVFAAAARFSLPGTEPRRLISLQRVAGELDAVELKAWQDVSRVLAHEMMNSLTPIASLSESLEVLLRGAAPYGADIQSELAGAVEAIKRRSLGLMDFVERYRQIAELPTPVTEVLRLNPFMTGIERLMRATFIEKGIAYASRVEESAVVIADPRLLEHAVINLIRNAIDAVAAAENPTIQLSCRTEDNQVVIAISDNGCGLPDKEADEMFVPFFTTKSNGSGVGLSLVRQIALAHGGSVDARHVIPQGAVFSLAIPNAS